MNSTPSSSSYPAISDLLSRPPSRVFAGGAVAVWSGRESRGDQTRGFWFEYWLRSELSSISLLGVIGFGLLAWQRSAWLLMLGFLFLVGSVPLGVGLSHWIFLVGFFPIEDLDLRLGTELFLV